MTLAVGGESVSTAPDVTIDHFPETCRGCGEALGEATAIGYTARQVFDLPAPQPLIVTEHRPRSRARSPTSVIAAPAALRRAQRFLKA